MMNSSRLFSGFRWSLLLYSLLLLQLKWKVEASSLRRVEEDAWRLEELDRSFDSFKVILNYKVSDYIEDDWFRVSAYRDGDCSKKIDTDSKFDLKVNIFPDETPIGTGSGTRNFEVRVVMHEESIQESSMLVDGSIVSWCLRVSLVDTTLSLDPQTKLDTQIAVRVDFVESTGIKEFLQDPALVGGVDVYQCNNLTKIESPDAVSQGQVIRLCMYRNDEMKDHGIYFRDVNIMTLSRDGSEQTALVKGGRVGDELVTNVECERGASICAIELVLRNAFFESTGTVSGSGTMLIQYGSSGSDSASDERSKDRRELYVLGEYLAERTFDFEVFVSPSSEEFTAEAFHCNAFNEEVAEEASIVADNGARICVRPDEAAREAGVYMRRIDSFSFTRDGERQKAVEGGVAVSDGSTLLSCTEGDTICFVKTDLDAGFFHSDGAIQGTGTATLQFGWENRLSYSSDRREVRARIRTRFLEEYDDSDPGYAGFSDVNSGVAVSLSSKTVDSGKAWWVEAPAHLKILYLMAFFVAALLCCCCCAGSVLFGLERRKRSKQDSDAFSKDSSMDAFLDSKDSFYTDLDFTGDESEGSALSDEFDDDPNPWPSGPRAPPGRSRSMSADDPQRHPFGSTPSDTPAVNPLTGRPLRPAGMSKSEHTPSKPWAPNFGKKKAPTDSDAPPTKRRPNDRLSKSEHLPGSKGDKLGNSTHSTPNGGGPIRRGKKPGAGRGPNGPPAGGRGNGPGRGRGPGRGLSQSEHLPRREMPPSQAPAVAPDSATKIPPKPKPPKRSKSSDSIPSVVGNGEQKPERKQTLAETIAAAEARNSTHNSAHSKNTTGSNPPEDKPATSKNVHPKKHLPKALTKSSHKKHPPQRTKSSDTSQPVKKKKHLPRNGLSQSLHSVDLSTDPTLNGTTHSEPAGTKPIKKHPKKRPPKKKLNSTSVAGSKDATTSGDVSVDKIPCAPSMVDNIAVANSGASVTSELSMDSGDDEFTPDDMDVCFDSDEFTEGMKKFRSAIRKTLEKLGPVDYSPAVHRNIRKQLPGRRYFIRENRGTSEWKKLNNKELSGMVQKYYEEEKEKFTEEGTRLSL
eukprot:Nitzschia sp. Nitz4//scaffold31_size150131//125760//129062//NITZ4_002849-RA/size150131-augustus-gene-0.24-mRNA-1//-1//CDS//3329547722//338//frame0